MAPTGGNPEGRAASAATTEDPSETPKVVFPGTANFLAKYWYNGDVWSSAVYESAGTVGIGTTTPLDMFHVRLTNTTGAVTGLARQNLGNTATSYSGLLFYDQNGALSNFQGFNNGTHEYRINNIARNGANQLNGSINVMIGGTSRFFVSTVGNVGIGTTVPSTNLDVSNALSGSLLAGINATSFASNPFGSPIIGRKARGTAAAPAAVQDGDVLALFAGAGYGATAFGTNPAGVGILASETWTDSAQGSRIQLTTTPNGMAIPTTRMRIEASGRVGIGTLVEPAANLEVSNAGSATPGTGIILSSFGAEGPNVLGRRARGTAAAPTAVEAGDALGGFSATGYGETQFGGFGAGIAAFAAQNWTNTAQGSVLAVATTPWDTTAPQIAMIISPNGNTGIGLPTTPGLPLIVDRLAVFGDIRVGTSGSNGCLKNFNGDAMSGTCSSDRRFKRDITPFRPVLHQLTALQPVHYRWRAADFPERHFGDSRAYGLIAQEVEQVLPELVVTGADGFKAVDYSKLPLLTIQAVKELKAENDADVEKLKAENDAAVEKLQAENDALKQRVAELERLFTEMLAATARR